MSAEHVRAILDDNSNSRISVFICTNIPYLNSFGILPKKQQVNTEPVRYTE